MAARLSTVREFWGGLVVRRSRLRRQDAQAGPAVVPTTLFGCYIAASLLGDVSKVQSLSPEVQRLYFADPPYVIAQSVFHRLVMGYFDGTATDVAQVERFAAQLTALPASRMPSEQDVQELLLEKLGLIPPRWAFADRRDELFTLWMVVGWRIVSIQPVPVAEVLRQVAEAEASALASGVQLVAATW